MSPLPSRLLERLDAEIALADDPFSRECLKARRAAALARQGSFPEARFALAGLRSQSKRLRMPLLAAWVALVEGQIEHCESLADTARGRFAQARQLAIEAGDPAMQGECAAWLAVSDFNANDPDAMARHAAEALLLAPADGHVARARASLVVADALRYAGEDDAAQPWYAQVRGHAMAEGDVSIISMLLHNVAAFRAGRIALDDALGNGNAVEAQRVLMEAESTGNYDAGVGHGQLLTMVPLLKAQMLVVVGRFEEAVSVIDAQMPRAREEGQTRRVALFLADAAYCEVRLGRHKDATRRMRLVQPLLAKVPEPDDQAAMHARFAVVARALGREETAADHEARAAESLARYRAEQQRWLGALAPVLQAASPAA
jgi:hypothetical protein